MGAFYDHYSNEGGVLPEMTLVERKSVAGQNAATLTLPANTVFTETWTLKNTGIVSGEKGEGRGGGGTVLLADQFTFSGFQINYIVDQQDSTGDC